MKEIKMPDIALIALAACSLLQFGGQLFAVSVVASTIAEAPPRSFAILNGEYAYNSSIFWDTVPPITSVLFIVALVSNWKNKRRNLILSALVLYIIAALLAYLYLGPVFANMIDSGYSDEIDPLLKKQATRWYYIDWSVWALGLVASIILLFALTRPWKNTN